ncbi:MAG: DUF192 domain-containing protein [Patescibacteria group bacterium]|nr:DUF192 domain-containing protein [Patescibacteria group bacterium]
MFFAKGKQEVKNWHWYLLIAIVIFFAILKITDIFYWPKAEIKIGGAVIKVLVADRPTHWNKGWSDVANMGDYQGMFFKFVGKGQHVMVMRDMNFALDIIWLDGGTIVDMAPNLPPEKGVLEGDLTRYSARLPSTAVLELPAGFIASQGLKIGDKVESLP